MRQFELHPIRPIDKPRENWKSKFEKLAIDPDEEQMIPDVFEDEEV